MACERKDALGTVRGSRWGRRGRRAPSQTTADRLPSLIPCGRRKNYDGPFGVIAGIMVVDPSMRSGKPWGFRHRRAGLGDEGARGFPRRGASAGCDGRSNTATCGSRMATA